MKHDTGHSSLKRVSNTNRPRIHLTALLAEREEMREEIRQLTAAVHLYSEIVRRLESSAAPPRAA